MSFNQDMASLASLWAKACEHALIAVLQAEAMGEAALGKYGVFRFFHDRAIDIAPMQPRADLTMAYCELMRESSCRSLVADVSL